MMYLRPLKMAQNTVSWFHHATGIARKRVMCSFQSARCPKSDKKTSVYKGPLHQDALWFLTESYLQQRKAGVHSAITGAILA